MSKNQKINNMKKFLFMGAIAAMLLGTASCSNDMEPEMTDDGTVQFTIELPGAVDSRAIADGLKATDLQVAVYQEKDDGTRKLLNDISLLGDKKVTMVEKKATVTFKLVKGLKYSFAFWAQNPNEDAYTFDAASGKVTVDYSKAVANADDGDAFSYYVSKQKINGPLEKTVTLYRPFAQLNYGDVVADYDAAVAAGVDIKQTVVTVKQVATEFDIMTQKTSSDNLVDVTWPAAASVIDDEDLTVDEEDYKWLSMCYFLVPNNQSTVETELSMLNTPGTEFNKLTVDNVPVEKNYRTNILGNLFTEDAVFNIVIDEHFKTPDYGVINGLAGLLINNGNYSGMTMYKPNTTVILTEDLLEKTRIVPGIFASGTTTWELNGHTISFKESNGISVMTRGSWNLTINGDGTYRAEHGYGPWTSTPDSKVIINGGDFYAVTHVLYCQKGTIEVNGGTFRMINTEKTEDNLDPNGNWKFLLNCHDADYTAGTAKIIVKGGKFYNFDPSNNYAEGPNTNFVAEGYKVISSTVGEDTVYEVVPNE